jgi:7-keto-8-aminopelargonate synthetase-like enzyme
MRLFILIAASALVCASAGLAEIASADQRARAAKLQQLATEVKEISRCMGIVSVEDAIAFQPLRLASHRKTDELAKAVEDYVTRYNGSRSNKQETVPGFRYRIWDLTLQAGNEKARPASALNREACAVLAR